MSSHLCHTTSPLPDTNPLLDPVSVLETASAKASSSETLNTLVIQPQEGGPGLPMKQVLNTEHGHITPVVHHISSLSPEADLRGGAGSNNPTPPVFEWRRMGNPSSTLSTDLIANLGQNHTPIPFAAPSAHDLRTLYDLIRVSPPATPPQYDASKLSTIRQITPDELYLQRQYRLSKIVLVRHLVSQFFDRAGEILARLEICWDNLEHQRVIGCMHQFCSTAGLPATIWSEDDIDTWSHATLFRPAFMALKFVQAQRIAITNEPSFCFSYAPSHSVIPDKLFVRAGFDLQSDPAPLTIVNKTPAAWLKSDGTHMLQNLQTLPEDMDDPKGQAIKFRWPTSIEGCDDQTRILVQIWNQMISYDSHLEIVTTAESTIFVARGEGEDADTMYISPSYSAEDCPVLAVFCWFALAADIFKFSDLNLPKADTSKWEVQIGNRVLSDAAGVVLPTCYVDDYRITTPRAC